MRPRVSALILAAGASARLGRPKQLLPFGPSTLLGTVVAEANAASALDGVVVVIGGAAAEIRRRIDFGGAQVVENPEFGQGCASSYRTGIAALDARVEAAVVLLADQPGVDRVVINTVVNEWRRTQDRIMLAIYRGREGHPIVFARALFEQLGALLGDKAAWKIVDGHRDWVRPVPVDRALPRDVNTWQQYEALFRDTVDHRS